ncbi:FHA domain-containing protein [Streptomyces sp. NPDC049813]|uniref:FHA domain-containing protein n=1 Tax=Streptomyces sp. NPDC049813 TaxID=3365597 RepID=UPI00378D8AE0
MQIRLTVVDPLGTRPDASARAGAAGGAVDVLVTAPGGTALAAVASGLAAAVAGGDAPSTVLYAGAERLDAQRCLLGDPPLIDGAVLSLGAPTDPGPEPDGAAAQLHVVAGPDAGGVHLLHGGQIRVGRSADADVPLDDPDVSRLHCAVTLAADGAVSVVDLGSTNGTTVDGRPLGDRPVRLSPGALLRLGESALRVAVAGGADAAAPVRTAPDGEGHVRVSVPGLIPSQPPADGSAGGSAAGAGQSVRGSGHDDPSGPGRDPGQGAGGEEGAGAGPRPVSAYGDQVGPGRAPGDDGAGAGRGSGDGGQGRGGQAAGYGDAGGTGQAGGYGDSGRAGRAAGYGDAGDTGQAAGYGDAGRAVRAGGYGDSGPAGQAGGYGDSGRAGRAAGYGDAGRAGQAGGYGDAGRAGRAAGNGDADPAGQAGGYGGAGGTGQAAGYGSADPAGQAGGYGDAGRAAQAGGYGGASCSGRGSGYGGRGESLPGPRQASAYGAAGGRGAASWDGGRAGAGDDARGTAAAGSWGGSRREGRDGFARGASGAGSDETRHAYGDASWGAAGEGYGGGAQVPGQGGPPEVERTRLGTPPRGTPLPRPARRRGGLGRLLRRGRDEQDQQHEIHEPYALRTPHTPEPVPAGVTGATEETWPDAAALLLTALGPGPRLWERGPGHPEALAVRLGTVDRTGPDGAGLLPAVPVTVGIAEAGALGLAGPRARLTGLARCALAQLAALHAPDRLEIVLIATDRARTVEERVAEWSWLGWLPHVRPAHGQDCRLLLAYDRDQAAARTGELLRRLDDHAAGFRPGRADPAAGGDGTVVPTIVVVDGDPGSATLREATARLAAEGAPAGIHVLALAEAAPASPASPVAETYEEACAQSPAFRACGAVALLSGDVATALRLHRAAHGQLAGHGTVATVDAVSLAWAQRFARALAPLRTDAAGGPGSRQARVSAPLPQSARLLDELGLARATPASLLARWAAAADDPGSLGGRVWAVLGAGPRGPVAVDLAADGPHLLIEGPAGSGRTELLRSVTASLAAAERPDRLGVVLVDGQGGGTGGERGQRVDGLRVCTDLPHVTTHLAANDPVRMREFAQSLTTELKRRAELTGRTHFTEWHTQRAVSGRMVAQRGAPSAGGPSSGGAGSGGAADLDAPPSAATIRLRPGGAPKQAEAGPVLPRLVVIVDDLDALLAPPLGSPGRPAAGSVVRALEAVARDGERLGVHLVAAFASGAAPGWAGLPSVVLDPAGSGAEDPAPGRGVLRGADGRDVGVQAGRVTGRIPRTATQRPTVVGLDWARMGDPPDRRPVRELGNGPTDLALLASALERAARSVAAREVPSLL